MRSPRLRSLNPGRSVRATVTLAITAALSLSACNTKVGVAAIANGHRISESTLNSYLTSSTTRIGDPVTGSRPRTFVLFVLIYNQLAPEILSHVPGPKVTEADLQQATLAALQGGSEDDLRQQLVDVGLKASFEPAFLNYLRARTVFGQRVTSQTAEQVLNAAHLSVQVNPRYGAWDNKTVADMSSKQIPANVTLSTVSLPGDPSPAQSSAVGPGGVSTGP